MHHLLFQLNLRDYFLFTKESLSLRWTSILCSLIKFFLFSDRSLIPSMEIILLFLLNILLFMASVCSLIVLSFDFANWGSLNGSFCIAEVLSEYWLDLITFFKFFLIFGTFEYSLPSSGSFDEFASENRKFLFYRYSVFICVRTY